MISLNNYVETGKYMNSKSFRFYGFWINALIFCVLFFACNQAEVQTENEKIPGQYYRTQKQYSFAEEIAKIQVVVYNYPRLGVGIEDEEFVNRIYDEKTGELVFQEFKNTVVLNSEQSDSLQQLLLGYEPGSGTSENMCYWPDCCIHFLNKNNQLIHYLEFSSPCRQSISSTEELQITTDSQFLTIYYFFKYCGLFEKSSK